MAIRREHTLAFEQLALLIDRIEDYAIFMLGLNGEIRSWNAGAERLMGYTAEEAIGKNFSIFYGPGDLAAMKPQSELAIATEEGRVEDEGWRVRKDGTRFWVSTIITALRDDSGVLTGFAKITRDLTQRREADERLRRSEELFRLIVSSVKDYAIFMLDPDGRIVSWNPGAERIKGYKPDEIIGRHFSTFYPIEDVRSHKPERELEIAKRDGSVEDEGWRIRKDGTRFWANVIITAVYDEHRELRGFAKVTRDITARREAEQQLRESEEIFRLLVASVQEYAIFLLDPSGHIRTWNAGAQRIKGYLPEEIIGRHFSTFYSDEDNRNGKPARELEIAKREGMVEDEGWRIRKDGSRFWANVVITAVKDDHGELRGFAKVTRDMTERKQAQEMQQALYEQREARFRAEEERRQAEASYRVAQEANRAKDEFLMTLSHELRTPMTAILGWSRVLPTLPHDDESFSEAIAAIGRSAQLQARLIDDVLDVSRIVSGKLRLSPENVDIGRLLESSVEAVRPTAAAKSIKVTTDISPGLGAIVADATRLQQIIWNLLTNALKFTPRNGTVSISARRTSSHIQIAVADTGEGIHPGFLPHVFEPFRQAENPSTRVHGGLGLGLSIVRYLVEAHGGTVAAESEGRGKGATFTVTLPIGALTLQRPRIELAPPLKPVQKIERRLEGINILLVDDDHEGRRVFRALLRQAGADVTDVDSAARALERFAARRPDVLLTDIAMPEMDGYSLARQIRAEVPNQTIIALSAFPAGRAGGQDAVFDAYITKPVEPADLVLSIANVIGR
ncbi:MAG TPA: PAS domain S-box protein [Thermoanaerobaculia bacterium]|nr:PAS domain S-box protein [Thermoanaerobaculia bacterium]